MSGQLDLFTSLEALDDTGDAKQRKIMATRSFMESGPGASVRKHAQRNNIDDENGVSMAARYAANASVPVAVTEFTGGAPSIPASATRLFLRFQNLSQDTFIWWRFGASVNSAAAFLLQPGASETFNGMGMMRDGVSFVTATGQAAGLVWQDDVAP